VRETWRDTLYEIVNEYAQDGDPVLGERGPFTLDATYTIWCLPMSHQPGSSNIVGAMRWGNTFA